eukprot:COSAG02_NODE_20_length_53673_cov_86.864841_34_plen_233_part_00
MAQAGNVYVQVRVHREPALKGPYLSTFLIVVLQTISLPSPVTSTESSQPEDRSKVAESVVKMGLPTEGFDANTIKELKTLGCMACGECRWEGSKHGTFADLHCVVAPNGVVCKHPCTTGHYRYWVRRFITSLPCRSAWSRPRSGRLGCRRSPSPGDAPAPLAPPRWRGRCRRGVLASPCPCHLSISGHVPFCNGVTLKISVGCRYALLCELFAWLRSLTLFVSPRCYFWVIL